LIVEEVSGSIVVSPNAEFKKVNDPLKQQLKGYGVRITSDDHKGN